MRFPCRVAKRSILAGLFLAGMLAAVSPSEVFAAPIRIPIEGGTVPINRDFALSVFPRGGSKLEVGLAQLGNRSFAPGTSVEIFSGGRPVTKLNYPGTPTDGPITTALLDIESLRDPSTGNLPPLTVRAGQGLFLDDVLTDRTPLEIAPERLPPPAPGGPPGPAGGPPSGPAGPGPGRPATITSGPYPDSGLVPCRGEPCKIQDLVQLGVNIFNWLLAIGGAAALLALIVGGTKYITAVFGAEGRDVAGAKQSMVYAIIGLVVLLGAFVIVRTVTSVFELSREGLPPEAGDVGDLIP